MRRSAAFETESEQRPLPSAEATHAEDRPAADVPPLVAHALALQRLVGNRATSDLLARASSVAVLSRNKRGPPGDLASPRRSKRRRVQTGAVDRERFWSRPSYGPSTSFGGGSSVDVDLGPAAGQSANYGSRPGTNSCTAVDALILRGFRDTWWVKGHLLNDNLGGPGTSENLTPMTHDANMAYKNQFESKVKYAIAVCYSHGATQDPYWYGVRLRIAVAGSYAGPERGREVRAIRGSVETSCRYIRKRKSDRQVLATATPRWAPALPGPLSIACFT